MSQASVIRISPFHYIHVLDNNSNVTRVEKGPASFAVKDHESVVFGPAQMIMIPPRHYCIVKNPVIKKDGVVSVINEHGQVALAQGDEEIRFDNDPVFPLYPGEQLYGKVSPLQVVAPNTALRLRAVRDFDEHRAGNEFLFKGPATYMPRVEVQVVEIVRAIIVLPNQALRLRARRACTSTQNGKSVKRNAGEEWLVREEGAYLPDVFEEVRETVKAYTLTEKKALQLEAISSFVDELKVKRNAGERWLVTLQDKETHIPDVNERVIGEIPITTLNSRQYAVVVNPVKNGVPQLGKRELRTGEVSFFLRPGERLESGIQNVHVLDADQALLLRAREAFTDGKTERAPGDRWMIYGPTDYVPPVSVDIVEKRRGIPLDKNEGIYVRNVETGQVRSVTGQTYMLDPSEQLWSKELPAVVEDLLNKDVTLQKEAHRGGAAAAASQARDKTRVVTFRTPHNSAVQVFDFKAKKARVVFGPDLVMLGPDEQFTLNSLSGDVPKRPHVIKSLSLLLGPDFMTDVVVVETSDHARLSLKLSYNWNFEVEDQSAAVASKIFSVPDFVGDACKALASRVRGAVASQTFDDFHKYSARIIREAVFGVGEDGAVRNKLVFSNNSLAITNIDIQSVEPVDSRTRDALQKSVQLAIEITTKSQEAAARHEAERREQQARGRLERQKIDDEAKAEKSRTILLQLQAQSAAVESTGQASAEATARAESSYIEGAAAVELATLSAEAERIRKEMTIGLRKTRQEKEIAHKTRLNLMEVSKAKELAKIDADKFKAIVGSIGVATLEGMAKSEAEAQAELLASLNLSSYLVTDGSNPVNLFDTAQGLIGQ
eukprot:TRINITY_DN12176_c1_g1_i1.p1 TRINITY_DN12176_c1_g1~~TRINITY_DN12176_c1_g1_i1.p1  ORF type:complete len:839 (-),score=227.85 TRINITY_DN12176_c1_g1_i1:134-2629(-)